LLIFSKQLVDLHQTKNKMINGHTYAKYTSPVEK